ncbi:hypothetical protein AVEN_203799-1 [Araneus ventricosus]|uniref:Uncharacterized protein n=2 Tax=Araneus ventricosus TaxID=182803 RepID=A0A4Y2TXD7_ARAVE|nr:hypothetical protein AVEN_203799-1 [Araneus ventricosus]
MDTSETISNEKGATKYEPNVAVDNFNLSDELHGPESLPNYGESSHSTLTRREQRARESLGERFQRRSARNAADRLRRARARNEQQMANRVNSHVEMNVSEHDPGYFLKEGQENEAAERASIKDTTLTACFKLNLTDEEAHEYYYADIPQYYVFYKVSEKWQKRKRWDQQVIGRMPVVSVQDSERFYLRMLLLRNTAVISFNDLKTVTLFLCDTFQKTCKELELLYDDQHWHGTLLEAARMHIPIYL